MMKISPRRRAMINESISVGASIPITIVLDCGAVERRRSQ
jgi:hypothetical protein